MKHKHLKEKFKNNRKKFAQNRINNKMCIPKYDSMS